MELFFVLVFVTCVISIEFAALMVYGTLRFKNLKIFESMQVDDIRLNRFNDNIFYFKNYDNMISTHLSFLSKYHTRGYRIPRWSKAHKIISKIHQQKLEQCVAQWVDQL